MQQLAKFILRPSRHNYHDSQLGPREFILRPSQVAVRREEFTTCNSKGMVLRGSIFSPKDARSPPCILYLHSNNGSQIQGLEYLSRLLERGYSLCVFDFSGSGRSDGEFVSVGYWQSQDIKNVLKLLYERGYMEIAVWGRSMGAVAALLHTQSDFGLIKALVLDSPYSSLRDLVVELAWNKLRIPSILAKIFIPFVEDHLRKNADFSFDNLNVVEAAQRSTIPALFIGSEKDSMVNICHVNKLYEHYSGKKKQMLYINEEHAEQRSRSTINDVLIYLNRHLRPVESCFRRSALNKTCRLGDFRELALRYSSVTSADEEESPLTHNIRRFRTNNHTRF